MTRLRDALHDLAENAPRTDRPLASPPGPAGRHTAASHATKSPGLVPASEPGPVQYAYLS